MMIWVYIAIFGTLGAIILLLVKICEIRYGLPVFLTGIRTKLDGVIVRTSIDLRLKMIASYHELRESLSHTPHLLIHLAIVVRDKLRIRFSHYIDEVKGRKKITTTKPKSDFINAVQEHKESNGKGLIE